MSEPEPWRRIFNRILTEIPSCDAAMIRQAIFNTMIDFTSDTNLWIEEIPFAVDPNLTGYTVQPQVGFPNRLLVVYKDGDPNKRWADNGITMRVPGVIQLYRAPAEAQTWVAAISKACSQSLRDMPGATVPPPPDYPVVDSWIPDMYSDVVYYGAMSFLQRMPAKPWRDKDGAKENSAIYSSQKAQARVQNKYNNVYNAQAWAFPQSFRTISKKGMA